MQQMELLGEFSDVSALKVVGGGFNITVRASDDGKTRVSTAEPEKLSDLRVKFNPARGEMVLEQPNRYRPLRGLFAGVQPVQPDAEKVDVVIEVPRGTSSTFVQTKGEIDVRLVGGSLVARPAAGAIRASEVVGADIVSPVPVVIDGATGTLKLEMTDSSTLQLDANDADCRLVVRDGSHASVIGNLAYLEVESYSKADVVVKANVNQLLAGVASAGNIYTSYVHHVIGEQLGDRAKGNLILNSMGPYAAVDGPEDLAFGPTSVRNIVVREALRTGRIVFADVHNEEALAQAARSMAFAPNEELRAPPEIPGTDEPGQVAGMANWYLYNLSEWYRDVTHLRGAAALQGGCLMDKGELMLSYMLLRGGDLGEMPPALLQYAGAQQALRVPDLDFSGPFGVDQESLTSEQRYLLANLPESGLTEGGINVTVLRAMGVRDAVVLQDLGFGDPVVEASAFPLKGRFVKTEPPPTRKTTSAEPVIPEVEAGRESPGEGGPTIDSPEL
jgi:hypothetical protein